MLNGFELTRDNFADPPREMGILPFWFWNGELDEKELEWQLREFWDKGISGLFVHGRFGLAVPYLSDAWFERIKFTVEKAKEIGIDIWIYDEMNWPSGTAERQVLKAYPHLSQKYLEMVVLDVYGPIFTFLEATDHRYVNTGNSKPIAAFACTEEEFNGTIEYLVDLTPNLSFEKVIPWEAPEGNWKLLYFLEKEADYYIDALNPESTQRFIELTYEKYKSAVGHQFGKVVPGFYTDEPAMHYYHVGMDNYVIPWSSQMFKIFRQRRGYDLRSNLPALFLDVGEKTEYIRYDFWSAITEQYAETYYKQIRDWCDDNKVIFTGHLLFEEWLRMHARCEGNIFKLLKHMSLIGVDHLYPKIGTKENPAEHVALKIASSAAHHFGSTRLLCESMGGTYWDCTLERMKWIANWEYVLGVNLLNNHGYHYSIEGERKRDWPPSQFYHHTWWKYYNLFTTYMDRLGHILSGGQHIAKVLMLYPINSIWTNYVPQKRNEVGNVIESDFNCLTDTLLRLHFDFDYVDEDVLAEADIVDGKIKIADEEYSLFILPPVTHIKEKTLLVLEQFLNTGGKIIASTLLPIGLLESEIEQIHERIKKLFGMNSLELMDSFKNDAKYDIYQHQSNGNVYIFKGKGFHQNRPIDELNRILNECIVPDVSIKNEDVFYLHRVKDNRDIYFFINSCQKNIGNVKITFEKISKPELWDPSTGEINPINVYKIKNNRLCIELDFSATDSHVVILEEKIEKPFILESNLNIERFEENKIQGYTANKESDINIKIDTSNGIKELTTEALDSLPSLTLGDTFDFEIEDENVLSLHDWKMRIADSSKHLDEVTDLGFDDSEWLDVTMGAWEMQLPQERDEESYPITVWYRTSFEIVDMPSNLKIMIDGFSGSEYRFFINGKAVKDRGQRSFFDAEMKEVDILPLIQKGNNGIFIQLKVHKRTDGILDLIKIVGDFSLLSADGKYKIVRKKKRIKLGSWTDQGYPFFSGTGSYTTQIDVPESYKDGLLFLEVECGEDVLEVWFNNHLVKIVPWHPYRIDVSKHIKPGRNQVTLKVTNTLINFLEAVTKPSGIFSEPRLIHAHRYTLNF